MYFSSERRSDVTTLLSRLINFIVFMTFDFWLIINIRALRRSRSCYRAGLVTGWRAILHLAYKVLRVAISRPCPVGPLPISSRAPEDSGGDMAGHRLPRLLAPSPRGRPYVLVSVCKGISYFFNTQKKFQEIFKKYLILLILNELQKAIFWGFFRVFRGKTF